MKSSHPTKLGGSLQVPFVQELAEKQLTAIPSRYVRPTQDPTCIISTFTAALQVPVIDMNLMSFINFTMLVKNGVSFRCALSEEFFKLAMEEKKKFGQHGGDVEGYGQAFVVSEDQKLDWGDMFYMVTLPTYLRKPHLFPHFPLSFRNAVAKCLQLDSQEIENLFKEGMQAMRINYYPPCPEPDKVIGLTPHSDSVGLTILLQLNEMEGLQVRKNGIWIPVTPLPSAFIVNIGDILEFRNISVTDYYKGYFARELGGKSYLDTLRI